MKKFINLGSGFLKMKKILISIGGLSLLLLSISTSFGSVSVKPGQCLLCDMPPMPKLQVCKYDLNCYEQAPTADKKALPYTYKFGSGWDCGGAKQLLTINVTSKTKMATGSKSVHDQVQFTLSPNDQPLKPGISYKLKVIDSWCSSPYLKFTTPDEQSPMVRNK